VDTESKVFCTCKYKSNEYRGLHPPTLKNHIQYVHALCGKPTELVWRRWLRACVVCWGLYSSPWSLTCRACHREEYGTDAPFKGWGWARKVDEEFHRRLLDTARRMRYDTEVGEPMPPDSPQ
jgi:hypothetical protein